MKTTMPPQIKSQGLRQCKINDRWKWMARATAATAAAAATTAAQAGWVTVNQVGNYVDSGAGNHLNADLLNDGVPVIQFSIQRLTNANNATSHFNSVQLAIPHTPATFINKKGAAVYLQHYISVEAQHYGTVNSGVGYALARHDSQTDAFAPGTNSQVLKKVRLPIEFNDPNVNGDKTTFGILNITEFASNITDDARFTINAVSYDDLTPVPEPGNVVASLALLTLGAGGILVRRARKKSV